jgi:tyrosyl-tRNA synthetase
LRIKFGIDPTGTTVHIGHAVPILKLREFQKL